MQSPHFRLAGAVLLAALLWAAPARPWSSGPTGWCTDESGRNFRCDDGGPSESPGPRGRWDEPGEPQPPSAQSQANEQYNRGLDLDRQGRFAEAEEAYRQAIALYPHDGAFFNNLGAVLHAQSRHAEAQEAWRQAMALGNANARGNLDNLTRWLEEHAHVAAANQLAAEADQRRAAKDYAGAARLWREVLGLFPDHVPGWQELALCLRLQALSLDFRNPERPALLGQALEAVRQALRREPDNLASYRRTAEVLDDLGRREEAVVFLKESLRRGETKANVLAALRTLLSYNSFADSAPYLRAVRELDPEDAAARDSLARALRAAAEDGRQPAAARVAAAKELAGQDPGGAGNQALLGAVLIAAGQADNGRKAFAEAFRLAPEDWSLRHDLARALAAAGDHAGAAGAYRQAIALAGPEVEATERAGLRFLLGLALEGARDPAGAEAALREGLALAPEEPVLHTLYALFLERQIRLLAAERELRQALALAPGDEDAAATLADFHRRRGLAAQEAGRPEAAERLLSLARVADPGNAELAAAQARAAEAAAKTVRQGLGERAAALSATLAELGSAAPPAAAGRSPDFSAWTVRPLGGTDTNAGRQANSVQATGRRADEALGPERAAAWAGLGFDTHGIPAAALPAAPARGQAPAPAAAVPLELRADPLLAALLQRRQDLQAQLTAQQDRTAAAEAARGASPEALAAAARERRAGDRIRQALDFVVFSEAERVAELQRQASPGPDPGQGGSDVQK